MVNVNEELKKEERKEEALKLKGNHKLYLCIEEDCSEGDIYNTAEVADLDDCIEPEHKGDRWIIPDHTPDWLYSIIELYSGCELMESVFEFDSKETIKELAEICDTVINGQNI